MNAPLTDLVRCLCMLLLCMLAGQLRAQGAGNGLTKEFDKLSAKERSRIAARETKEAAADSSYQQVMRDADQAFRERRYEDALATFRLARGMRPYNVYPKVKIQDLQALIEKRDREAAEKNAAAPPVEAPLAAPVQDAAPEPAAEAPSARPVQAPPAPLSESTAPEVPEAAPARSRPPVDRKPEPTPREQARPAPVKEKRLPVQAAPPRQARTAPPTGERVYMEAGAVVTERSVEDAGMPVVYKKVVHSWGQTFYFKGGQAISEREWKERFKE